MEDFPGSLPEAKPIDNPEKKKKRRKKGANLRVPLVAVEKDIETPEKSKPKTPEQTRFDETLARLMLNNESKEDKPAKKSEKSSKDKQTEAPAEPEAQIPNEASEAPENEADKPETPEAEDDSETYLPLPEYEPKPIELNRGEVIVSLRSEKPVEERVIPVQESAHEDPAESPAEPTPETPEFTPQAGPEQPQAAQPTAEAAAESPVAAFPFTPAETLVSPEPAPTAEQPRAEVLSQPIDPEVRQQYSPETEESGGGQPATLPVANIGGRPATQQEVDAALHRSAKIHEQRGALTGLFLGTYFANRRLRRRQIQEGRELDKQRKQLNQLTKEVRTNAAEQATQRSRFENRFANQEKRFEKQNQRAEKAAPQVLKHPEVEPEQLNIPPDHRLETSAWHAIEVDAKTGRAVESPTFEYGQEYYRERAHENRPAEERDITTGGAALVGAASNPGSTEPPTLPPNIPSASMQGPPLSSGQSAQSSSSGSGNDAVKSQAASSAPLWPWVVALVVIIVVLIYLLG